MNDKQPISADLVHDLVLNAHGNLPRVQELLQQEPALVHAVWDWGAGDFESGLGAAAHMGRPDIALYLLERGARMDIFTAAMLGDVTIVRALLEAYPAMREFPGAHGITLLAHAKAGGEAATEVVRLLDEQITSYS
jgi:hypothetical protein